MFVLDIKVAYFIKKIIDRVLIYVKQKAERTA